MITTDNAVAEVKKTAEHFKEATEEMFEMFIDRNNHHKDQFRKAGVLGCMIRMEDKVNDVYAGGKPPKEDRYECLLDIACYALMAAVIERETVNVQRPELFSKAVQELK